jgi:hypothetical protein
LKTSFHFIGSWVETRRRRRRRSGRRRRRSSRRRRRRRTRRRRQALSSLWVNWIQLVQPAPPRVVHLPPLCEHQLPQLLPAHGGSRLGHVIVCLRLGDHAAARTLLLLLLGLGTFHDFVLQSKHQSMTAGMVWSM